MESLTPTVAALHASGRQAVLAITGGGSGAIAELLRVPGGSRLLLEAVVPYAAGALARFLGGEPAQACSAETAVAMAERARARAAALAPAGTQVVGLGATASLVSDRPKQGEHRVHIAVAAGAATDHCALVLTKGRRDRGGEETLVARAIVLWLARACGVEAASPRSLLDADERFTESVAGSAPARAASETAIDRLVAGGLERLTVWPDGRFDESAPPPRIVLPGSFNPLHAGHLTLARVVGEMRQQPVAFEISVTNVDKPPLSAVEVRTRLAQFAGQARVELTRAPTFVEKSRLFPGVTFVVGADTAERLVAVRYYGGDEPRMAAAFQEIADRGCAFLVAVRADGAGRVRSLADAAIPPRFAGLFTAIPEGRFRLDASSSEIRARRHAARSGGA